MEARYGLALSTAWYFSGIAAISSAVRRSGAARSSGGFSTKSTMRVFRSTFMMPKPGTSASSTGIMATVTSAPFSWWNRKKSR